jgi:hypothetical protein
MRIKGKVIVFSTESGKGKIRSESGIKEFSVTDVIGNDLPVYNCEVEFELVDDIVKNVLVLVTKSDTPININVQQQQQQRMYIPYNRPLDTWAGIILWFILFWPWGLFKLFRKLSSGNY